MSRASRNLEWPLFVFLLHQVMAYFLVYWSALLFLPKMVNPIAGNWFNGFLQWDAAWYLSIAEYGYTTLQSTAFFPLYPWSIALVHACTGFTYAGSALLVAHASFLAALVMVHRFALLQTTPRVAAATTLLVAFSPTALFYNAAYSESLFLFLSVTALYCLKQRCQALAALSIFLATLARPQGLCLALAVLPQWWPRRREKGQRWQALGIAMAAVAGLALYMLLLHHQLHSALGFVAAQKYWDRTLVWPGTQLVVPLINMMTYYNYPVARQFVDMLNILAGAMTLLLILYFARRAEGIGLIYVVSYVLMTLSSAPGMGSSGYISMPSSIARFMMVLVPIYIWSVPSLLRSRTAYVAVLAVSTMLYIVLQIMFAIGYTVI